MTNRQKFKRILYSRYGVLTLLTLLLVVYILSFFEFPTKGGQQAKDNPLYVVLYFLVLLSVLDNVVFGSAGAIGGTRDIDTTTTVTMALNFFIAFYLLTLVPSISVSVRRLHDINRTGWWLLISLTIVGIIPLLYWSIKPSDEDANRFS